MSDISIHDIMLFMKYYSMNIFTVRLCMQLKTTVGLESRFMPISNALFRQRKRKGYKNGISCSSDFR